MFFFTVLKVQPNKFFFLMKDARDDIGGAINAGMKGVLVKTGKVNRCFSYVDLFNNRPTYEVLEKVMFSLVFVWPRGVREMGYPIPGQPIQG